MNKEQKKTSAKILSPSAAVATWVLCYYIFLGTGNNVPESGTQAVYLVGAFALIPAWLAHVWVRGFITGGDK